MLRQFEMRRPLQRICWVLIITFAVVLRCQVERSFALANEEPRRAGRFLDHGSYTFVVSGKGKRNERMITFLSDGGTKPEPHKVQEGVLSSQDMVNLQSSINMHVYSDVDVKSSSTRRLLEESQGGSISQHNNQEPLKAKREEQYEHKTEIVSEIGKESTPVAESNGNEMTDSKLHGDITENSTLQVETKEPEKEKGEMPNQEQVGEQNTEDKKASPETQEHGGIDDKQEKSSATIQWDGETKKSDAKDSGKDEKEEIKKEETSREMQSSENQQNGFQEQSQKQEDVKQDEIKVEERTPEVENQKTMEDNKTETKADMKTEENLEEHKMEDEKKNLEQRENYTVENKDDAKIGEGTSLEPEIGNQHKNDVNKVEDSKPEVHTSTSTEEKMNSKDDSKDREQTVKNPEDASQRRDDTTKKENNKQEADQQNSGTVTQTEVKVETQSFSDESKSPEMEGKAIAEVPQQQADDKEGKSERDSDKIEKQETKSETAKQELQPNEKEIASEKYQSTLNPANSPVDKNEGTTITSQLSANEKSDQKASDSQEDVQHVNVEKVEDNPANVEIREQDRSPDLKLDDHHSEETPQVVVSTLGSGGEAGLSWSNEQRTDVNYHDIMREFSNLPSKFQETAGQVAEKLLPQFQKISNKSKEYFIQANQHMTKSFLPLVGEQYAPLVASLICYALLLLPLALVIFLIERIRAIFSLQKVLLFSNIYIAAYFASLVLAFPVIGTEPILFIVQNSPSNFIFLQLVQGAAYILYLILQTANLMAACSDTVILAKLSASLQWFATTMVGLHYYVTVFHRTMAHREPKTSWKANAIYCGIFVVCCFFARIKRGKKEYVPVGDYTTDKKN